MHDIHILYGAPHSLYTGKTRAYLRKQGIGYVERTPAHPDFRERIAPEIGRVIIPVVVCPDGTILQDTVAILDHFEDAGVRQTARPAGAAQRVLAHVVELYAVVVLTRHAMHYRWTCLDDQAHFLRDAFVGGSSEATADKIMERMNAYLPSLGVTPATIPAIEQSYGELLDALEAHFAEHPYLFGAQASLGDYGLLGPMFAHLGRDPVPLGIMQRRAPKVFRWVERMNAPDLDMPEYGDYAPGYLPDDAVPETLMPLLRQIGAELFPELTDATEALRGHIGQTDPSPGDPVAPKPRQRTVANAATQFRGIAFDSGVQPYHFWLWQRVTDAFAAADSAGQQHIRDIFAATGLTPLLTTARPIRVERTSHIEVWGERT